MPDLRPADTTLFSGPNLVLETALVHNPAHTEYFSRQWGRFVVVRLFLNGKTGKPISIEAVPK